MEKTWSKKVEHFEKFEKLSHVRKKLWLNKVCTKTGIEKLKTSRKKLSIFENNLDKRFGQKLGSKFDLKVWKNWGAK